jgi:hypothetical protein
VQWATPGTKTITVTATNDAGGSFVARHTCEVREPLAFTAIGSQKVVDTLQDVAFVGSLAYVATGEDGLAIFDRSNPADPVLIGSYTEAPVFEVLIGEQVVYAGSEDEVLLLDVSQPTVPTLLARYPLQQDTGIYAMTVQGNMLFVVELREIFIPYTSIYNFVVTMIDVSNPATPTPVWQYEQRVNGKSSPEIQVVGNQLYLMSTSSLWVIENSNASEPLVQSIHYVSAPSSLSAFVVHGSLVYVLEKYVLKVLDISDLSNVQEVGSYPIVATVGDIQDVEVHGSYVFLQMEEGVLVIDVYDKEYPALAGSFSVPEGLKSAMFQDGLLYLGSADGALQMVQVAGLQPSHRSQVYLPMVAKTLR